MNTNSHIHIGVLLCRRMEKAYGIKLPRAVFVAANCRPDYSIKYKRVPHYKDDMEGTVREMIRTLAFSDKSRLNAYRLADRLGVICHYLCDFFCYAHTDAFVGTTREHLHYESQLNRYLSDRLPEMAQCMPSRPPVLTDSVCEMLDNVEDCYRNYRKSQASFAADISFSLCACEQVLAPLLLLMVDKSQLNGRHLAGLPA